MERIEMVEKIRECAAITVEEARDVLERNNWDMLDAMVELEREGKIFGGARATTKNEEPQYVTVAPTVSGKEEARQRRMHTRQNIKNGFRKAVRVVLDNKFIVNNKDGELVRVPVIVPIICLLVGLWVTVIAMIVGMIFGLRYAFEGNELGKQSINDGMMKAGDYTQNIVNDITGKVSEEQNKE